MIHEFLQKFRKSSPDDWKNGGELSQGIVNRLRGQYFGCELINTERGSEIFITGPAVELRRYWSKAQVVINHRLYAFPTSPVITIDIVARGAPENSLAFGTTINVLDETQRQSYASLVDQSVVPVRLYDYDLKPHGIKWVSVTNPASILQLLNKARVHADQIPHSEWDFDKAINDLDTERKRRKEFVTEKFSWQA